MVNIKQAESLKESCIPLQRRARTAVTGTILAHIVEQYVLHV
jgi:hypothetical protein